MLYLHAHIGIPLDREPDDEKVQEAEEALAKAVRAAFPVHDFVDVDSEIE